MLILPGYESLGSATGTRVYIVIKRSWWGPSRGRCRCDCDVGPLPGVGISADFR